MQQVEQEPVSLKINHSTDKQFLKGFLR